MEPERWRRVEELYHRALEVDAGRRVAFLEDSCGGDTELRREVESLLAREKQAEHFMDSPALEMMGKDVATELAVPSVEASLIGSLISHYRIVDKLGSGGMGEVWLAEQKQPVRRRVALKLIKVGMDTREVVTRFESERQALALMDHPAIAKVFDAGSTPQGRPYFVMEYVPGIPITDWCDKHKLTVPERLELFTHVCEGVNHAHQKAIIHRDLKPSNILVTEVDGKATPRIIDFGIAKAVSQRLSDDTLLTRAGVMLGTPQYMSPEQADSAGEDIDTRTDVYSLGVILYEMLVGAAPLETGKLSLEETLRKLRDEDPPRPSTKLRTLGERSTTTCANRRTEAGALGRQLRGDLDSIVLKALEKQRSRRYGSPSEFAADIGRYLRHEPVEARPASAGYRVRKYIRRHRIGVAFAAGLVLLLVGFAIAQAVQLRKIKRERDRADRITAFMTGMFKMSNPSEARGKSITAREILDKASGQIGAGLTKDPELQVELLDVIGNVYFSLGLYSQAEPLLVKAVETGRRALGPEHSTTVGAMNSLSIDLSREGKFADAEKLGREVLKIRRRDLGPDRPETIQSMNSLALTLLHEGQDAEAEELLREALEGRRRVLGNEHPDTLSSMNNLAAFLTDRHRYPEAEKLHRETLEIRQHILGADHPETLLSMNNLAGLLNETGRHSEAESLLRRVVEARSRILGAEHPYTLTSARSLAMCIGYQGHFDEAQRLLRQTREIQRRVLGPNHPDTADTSYDIACLAALQGNRDEAFSSLQESLGHGLVKPVALGIDKDPDLNSLHSDPRFAALVAYAHQRADAPIKPK
jgi:eukaryotic-like serine/threonine-protein kinase